MFDAHPYEMPFYDLVNIVKRSQFRHQNYLVRFMKRSWFGLKLLLVNLKTLNNFLKERDELTVASHNTWVQESPPTTEVTSQVTK